MRSLPRWVFVAAMLVGSALITASSLGYFDDELVPEFVIEKLPTLRFEALWLFALKVHVVAAAFALPACIVLLLDVLQKRLAIHRWLGRVTGVVVLLALVPSGAVLAFEAKGGAWVTAGFLASGALIAVFMVAGVVNARRRELALHRHAMWHVVAQMSVAVTSRTMLLGLELGGLDPDVAYVVALWVPVLGSALAVELLSPVSALRSFSAGQPMFSRRVSS
ncbi:MAG: DUF2306 domain-containing protein [Myxococcaceae bacterium]